MTDAASLRGPGVLMVDRTHMGRRASGIERITSTLFSEDQLSPLRVEGAHAPAGKAAVAMRQMVGLPLAALRRRETVWAFPGFPPSPAFSLLRDRCVLYVHDLFLMTRPQDLNRAARLYMAKPFALAIRRLKYFLANSETTARSLEPHIRADARVLTYRPRAENVFDLCTDDLAMNPAALIVGALGTIEPRKNFVAAARICEALSQRIGSPVELHVIGRRGWGEDYELLEAMPHVRLHGFLDDASARRTIQNFDLFLCTSHDEGLGLPLLEMQYAGLQIVAPDQSVFHEVLGASGIFIDPADPASAAAALGALIADSDWRAAARARAAANIARWNELAQTDRSAVLALLTQLVGSAAAGRGKDTQ